MILGLHHTAIATRNIERLTNFYETMFGLERIHALAWADSPAVDTIVGLEGSAARMIMLKAGNQCLELFEFSRPEPAAGDPARRVCDPGFTHIAFAVRDIDAEYARLKAAGMSFHARPTPGPALRVTYGRDPDGNVIELMEFLDEHPLSYTPSQPRWRTG